MDASVATIIVTIITSIFGVVTLLIQKKQDKVINKIDEQTILIDQERSLRQKLDVKKKELEAVTYKMIVLILETNLSIFRDMPGHPADTVEAQQHVFEQSESLKKDFKRISDEIDKITAEYEVVVSMSEKIHRETKNTNTK